jgi:hypothetical protein
MPSPDRAALLRWTARIGAVTAEALAQLESVSLASARARLGAAERDRLLSRHHHLAGYPALYTATRHGLRAAGLTGIDQCRVSAANSRHLIVCAQVAAALGRRYPEHQVLGERELRREEREQGVRLASALLGRGPDGSSLLHRPDLVLWPAASDHALPVAVEVELTRKAQRRLAGICRAWARSRCVSGVVYLAAPGVERVLRRAIDHAQAGERVSVVPLEALPFSSEAADGTISQRIPSDA